MTMEFTKAERKRGKLRLALQSPSGGGKTYSALLIAKGIGGKVGMIDTEKGSGSLYADLCDYVVLELTAPFSPERYIEAIQTAEKVGIEVLIIDSLSHEWTGQGGILEIHDNATQLDSKKNSFTAWKKVTPRHNALIEKMLQSSCHIIATMRSKQGYIVSEDDTGKQKIKKAGLEPIQRADLEFEFTTIFELSQDHYANIIKDRSSLFDGKVFVPTENTGKVLIEWLNTGKVVEPKPQSEVEKPKPAKDDWTEVWVYGRKKQAYADWAGLGPILGVRTPAEWKQGPVKALEVVKKLYPE